jgi:CheY-like chemotaxis protein
LTLVKTIVDLHGGTITAHSDGPGRGTEFVVRLPLSDEPAPAPSAPPSAPLTAAPGARKILIVDDDLDNRMLMRAALELDGHTVQVAADAAEALRQLEQFQPAVAILDIGLPGTNGYQLARLIRQRIEGKRVLLIALTGFGRPEDRERATAAGFDAHLVKPLKPEELDRVIASTQVDCR